MTLLALFAITYFSLSYDFVRLPVNVAREAIKIREDTVAMDAVFIQHFEDG